MSVISCKEIWNGRNGGTDQNFLARYVRVWLVVTDDPNDGTATVRTAPGIPSLFDFYVTPNETDFTSRVSDIRPRQDSADPRVWTVEVQYDGALNPFLQPPQIRWSSNRFSRIFELDIDNEPLLNSAGQFFDPPPEGDDSRPSVQITLNQVTFDPNLALLYQDAINSDALVIAGLAVAPFQAKLNIESTYNQDLNYAWWATTYTVEFQRNGWQKRILDQGRYQTGSGGKLKPCVGDDGSTPVADPVPLNGEGAQLSDPSPATAVYMTFDIYKELPFSALGLPV